MVLLDFKHRMDLIVENGGNHIKQLKDKNLARPDELTGANAE